MAPFAGDVVGAGQDMAADAYAAAHTGSDDDAEHDILAGSGAIAGFRKGKTIGVVLDAHRPAQRRGQIPIQRMALEADVRCVFDKAGHAAHRSGDGDAHATAPAELQLAVENEVANGGDDICITLRGRWHAFAQ